MRLNKEQEDMLLGKYGRGTKKAMEILIALGEAQGAEELVKISYAHLMPPDVMFYPFGRQGIWANEMTRELTLDVDRLRVTATIEPKFCDLAIAKTIQYTDEMIEEINEIQGKAVAFYEKIGVIPSYSALPFYVRPGKYAEHVSIAESIAILWYNTMFGSRCERDDGVTSLSAAITGYCPLAGAHLPENRLGEVIIQLAEHLKFEDFTDADWDAFSLASSRLCKEKRPVFVGIPRDIGITALKHLFAVIAVESGLAVMHILGITPEAPSLEKALGDREPQAEYVIGERELAEAYQLANTTSDRNVDFILLGCPHLTIREIRDLAEELDGKKIKSGVNLVAVTTRHLLEQARDLGYVDSIRKAGGVLASDMCIAFAGTQVKGLIATNSIKADFFYAGFSAEGKRKVRFGSTRDCAKSALTGKWEGKVLW
jgi:cis-L-3-hydroxyproline dehydratase